MLDIANEGTASYSGAERNPYVASRLLDGLLYFPHCLHGMNGAKEFVTITFPRSYEIFKMGLFFRPTFSRRKSGFITYVRKFSGDYIICAANYNRPAKQYEEYICREGSTYGNFVKIEMTAMDIIVVCEVNIYVIKMYVYKIFQGV